MRTCCRKSIIFPGGKKIYLLNVSSQNQARSMRKLRKMIYKEIRGPHELSNVDDVVERMRSTELLTTHTCKPGNNPYEWIHDFDEIDFVSCLDQKLHLTAIEKPRDVTNEIATGFLAVENLRNMQDAMKVVSR